MKKARSIGLASLLVVILTSYSVFQLSDGTRDGSDASQNSGHISASGQSSPTKAFEAPLVDDESQPEEPGVTEPVQLVQESVYTHGSIVGVCGLDSSRFSEFVENDLVRKDDQLTEQQVAAADTIVEKCNRWREGFFSHSNADEMVALFEDTDVKVDQMVEKVLTMTEWDKAFERDLLISLESDPTPLSAVALMFLLHHSQEFRNALGSSVGAANGSYVVPGSADINLLYSCRLEGDCSSNSFTALSACIANSQYCGQSIPASVANIHSINYAEDLYRMVDTIEDSYRKNAGS